MTSATWDTLPAIVYDIERAARIEYFTPEDTQPTWQWADENRILSPEYANRHGQWTSWAFQRGIMDAADDRRYRRVVAMLPSQVAGKTEILLTIFFRHIAQRPCPMLLVEPTLELAKRLSRKRIDTGFRDMPCLAGKLSPDHGARRERDNSMLYKAGPGWSLSMVGANRPSGLAMDAIMVLGCDEPDRYPPSAGDEGDVITLAEKRTTSYEGRAIVFICGSPTSEEGSRVNLEYLAGTQSQWLVPCPHCGFEQALQMGGKGDPFGLRWEKDEDNQVIKESVQYLCAGCAALIDERHKVAMVEAGHWEPAYPKRDIASFHLEALNSHILPWWKMAVEWHEAKTPEQQKAFVNTRRARVWVPLGEKIKIEDKKTEVWPEDEAQYPILPNDVAILTMAVDVQGDRLEVLVTGWGPGEEWFLVGLWRLAGSPYNGDVWGQVEALRTRTWKHESGARLRIAMTSVDTSAYTKPVADYVRPHEGRGVIGLKGYSDYTDQIVAVRPTKKSDKHRIKTWGVGTIAAKDVLFNRIRLVHEPGPGFVHISQQVDQEALKQLGAERRIIKRVGTQEYPFYERIGDRPNEFIDLCVYNIFGLHALGDPVRRHLDVLLARVHAAGRKSRGDEGKPAPKPEQEVSERIPEPIVEKGEAPSARTRRPPPRPRNWLTGF